MINVKEIAYEQTLPLRQSVLRPHLTLQQNIIAEDKDLQSLHLGAFKGEELVGIASFYRQDFSEMSQPHSYRLRQMGTVPELQGQGVGRILLEKAFELLKNKECPLLWCHARQVAFSFYEKLGFEYFGDFFDVPLIGPHKIMYKKL